MSYIGLAPVHYLIVLLCPVDEMMPRPLQLGPLHSTRILQGTTVALGLLALNDGGVVQ